MKIRLLGPTEVVHDDGRAIIITAAKPRWLLTFLALQPGRPQSVAAICDALWGSDEPLTATNLVQGYVRDLRRVLGSDCIRTTATGYALDLSADDVDAVEFQRLLRMANQAYPSDIQETERLLGRALGMWEGPALADGPSHGPLDSAAARLNERLLDAQELEAELSLATGQHSAIIPTLEELTRRHPFRERFWVQLATCLYRSDRQAEALARCADARRILREELGLSPGRELIEIEHRILEQDPVLLATGSAQPIGEGSDGFVGRDESLAVLERLRGDVEHGSQRLLFIGGEPGIGKSALVNEFVRRIRPASTVLLGRSDEHVAAPYLAFEQAVSDHLGSLEAQVCAELIRPRLHHAVALVRSLADPATQPELTELSMLERFETYRWLLEKIGTDGPLILILEDVHWADSTTLGLLRYLAEGERLPACLIVSTYRTSDASPILEDLLADLRSSPGTFRMVLDGLRGDSLRQLIGQDQSAIRGDEWVDWIETETGGNPFFVRELVRHAIETGSSEEVPAGISEVVTRRIRRLSPSAQELVVRAAVLGDDAPVGLLRALSIDLDGLSQIITESVHAGILVEIDSSEPRYRFSHSIIRKAAAASLTVVRRQDLHLAAAKAWETLGTGSANMPSAASHYLSAGSAASPDLALNAYIGAAAFLDKAGAKVEAVQWYDHALALLPADHPRCRSIRLTRFVVAQAAWHWHYDRKSIIRTNARE